MPNKGCGRVILKNNKKSLFARSGLKKMAENHHFSVRVFIKSGVESRNSERAFNYALGFVDTRFFQGLYGFDLMRGIGS